MQVNGNMEVMRFQAVIAPNGVGFFEQQIKANGTVERLSIRFYSGPQKALQIDPVIIHKGEKREPLVTYAKGTDQFVSGDNDYFIMPIVTPVEYLDKVRINYKNTDNANPYTLSVEVVVDYYAGTSRVAAGGVIDG